MKRTLTLVIFALLLVSMGCKIQPQVTADVRGLSFTELGLQKPIYFTSNLPQSFIPKYEVIKISAQAEAMGYEVYRKKYLSATPLPQITIEEAVKKLKSGELDICYLILLSRRVSWELKPGDIETIAGLGESGEGMGFAIICGNIIKY